MLTRSRRTLLSALAMAIGALVAQGCSGQPRAGRVDPPRAHEALKTALDHWKQGDSIDSLKSASPPIVVQDFDWMGGMALVEYEIAGQGNDDDANLRIPVKLTIRAPQGKEIKKSVSYVVGTSPALTVFRDFH